MADPLIGVGFAVLAAVGLTVQSLAVRLGTKTRSVWDVITAIFVVNVLVVVPIAGVVEYPQYGVTLPSLFAFGVAGIIGSVLARACYFIARIGASRTEPLKALFPVVAAGIAVVVLSAAILAGGALVAGATPMSGLSDME